MSKNTPGIEVVFVQPIDSFTDDFKNTPTLDEAKPLNVTNDDQHWGVDQVICTIVQEHSPGRFAQTLKWLARTLFIMELMVNNIHAVYGKNGATNGDSLSIQ
jgi:hypothetical protein